MDLARGRILQEDERTYKDIVMKNISGDRFDMVGKTFYFDSQTELELTKPMTISIKNNNSYIHGTIVSCEKLESGIYRIGVEIISGIPKGDNPAISSSSVGSATDKQ
jgi:hypothetical protein